MIRLRCEQSIEIDKGKKMKNINMFMITSSFYVFHYTLPYKDIAIGKLPLPNVGAKIANTATAFAVVFAITGIIAGIVLHIYAGKNNNNFYLSKNAISFVKDEQPQALFNNIDFSAELIENYIPVFIDTRVSVYGKKNFTNYLRLSSAVYSEKYNFKNDSFMTEIMDTYNFDAFLVKKTDPLYAYLVSFPDKYDLAYSDDKAAYFRIIE